MIEYTFLSQCVWFKLGSERPLKLINCDRRTFNHLSESHQHVFTWQGCLLQKITRLNYEKLSFLRLPRPAL